MALRNACLPEFGCTHSLIGLYSGKQTWLFTINFIETAKLTEEKFTPLKECTSSCFPRSVCLLQCLVTEGAHLTVVENKYIHHEWLFSVCIRRCS